MGLRGVGRLAGAGLLVVLVLPLVGLVPAAVVDRGPGGGLRVSPFPLALAVFDPFAWACVRNSGLVATAVAAGSLAAGLLLGIVAGRWRFWGRGVLWPMGLASLAAGPLLIAPGVLALIGGDRAWGWLAARSVLGFSCEDGGRWLALVWVGIACGAPIVAMATVDALGRFEASWSEAAASFGASRRRGWLDVTWPILRPELARAAASVFVLNLVEPAGPLLLGLRRTLAVQVIDAARRFDQPTRAATLAVMALGLAVLGRSLIVLWGGAATIGPAGPAHPAPRRAASKGQGLILAGISLAWLAFSTVPLLATLRQTFGEVEGWAGLARSWGRDVRLLMWAGNSLVIASLAVVIDLAILAALAGRSRPGPNPWPGRSSRVLRYVPGLVLAVGSMSIPWLLDGLADVVGTGTRSGRWLAAVAVELSPARWPGLLLVVTLAAARWPMLVRVAELSQAQARPTLSEAATSFGEVDRRAGRPRLLPIRVVLLSFALTATSLAPAQVLTPTAEGRTLAPALLASWLNPAAVPETGRDPATGPVALILGVNLMGFGLASRWRGAGIGRWFRG